jgi:hypothetical protein
MIVSPPGRGIAASAASARSVACIHSSAGLPLRPINSTGGSNDTTG